MPLVLSVNNYYIIVPGHTPNVHMIPSGNANNQNKSIPCIPFSATQFLRKSSYPLMCGHTPSKFH